VRPSESDRIWRRVGIAVTVVLIVVVVGFAVMVGLGARGL